MKKRILFVFLIALFIGRMEIGTLKEVSSQNILGVSIAAAAETAVRVESERELVNTIHKALLNRKESVTIKYSIPDYKLDLDKLFEKVLSIDKKLTSRDGDYLYYSLSSWSAQAKMIGSNTTLNCRFTYKTTSEEEQLLDKKIKSVLKALELEEASDYEKVKAIHDYIINRVSYDTKLEKSSAYNALNEKSAVCEGYSTLAYRMFLEAGLESRIISGTGDGVPHAWNIVKVKGKWYNIDLTWDDPVTSSGKPMLVYDYFLKSTKDFKGHKRDAKYKTEEFVTAYPISKTSYKMK
jgi:hypothetical protein